MQDLTPAELTEPMMLKGGARRRRGKTGRKGRKSRRKMTKKQQQAKRR
jgi:hypothetical protein